MVDPLQINRYRKAKVSVDIVNRRNLEDLIGYPMQKRSEQDNKNLFKILLNYPCFQAVAENDFDSFVGLSKHLGYKRFRNEEVIIRQGEEPDAAYVLVTGQCDVNVKFSYSRHGKTRVKSKRVCSIGKKQLFGELSLLFQGSRSASVTTTRDYCDVIVIPLTAFRRFMRVALIRKLNTTITFLRKLPWVKFLASNVQLILATKTVELNLQKDTVVTMQNQKSSRVYFIESGYVRIIRQVEFAEMDEPVNLHNYHKMFNDPKQEQRERGLVKSLQLQLCELKPLECFGESYETLMHTLYTPDDISAAPIPYTSMAANPVKLYAIKKATLYNYMDSQARQFFLDYIRQYPKDNLLRRYHLEQLNWESTKNSILAPKPLNPSFLANNVERLAEIKRERKEVDRGSNRVILPKIDKREQLHKRIMDIRANDQVTSERRLKELKNAHISNTDPFQLFTVLSQAAQSMTIAPSELKAGGEKSAAQQNTTAHSKSSKDTKNNVSQSAMASHNNKFKQIHLNELPTSKGGEGIGKRSQLVLRSDKQISKIERETDRGNNVVPSDQSRNNKTLDKFTGAWSQSNTHQNSQDQQQKLGGTGINRDELLPQVRPMNIVQDKSVKERNNNGDEFTTFASVTDY